MKKFFSILLLASLVFTGCNKDDDNANNPYLPNYNFSIDVDMSYALYEPLLYTGNAVMVNQPGPLNGVIVMNTGSGYTAFEATCPNQPVTECSLLEIDGINAVCPCDNAQYSLFTGLAPGKQYSLKPYRVTVVSQTFLRVYN